MTTKGITTALISLISILGLGGAGVGVYGLSDHDHADSVTKALEAEFVREIRAMTDVRINQYETLSKIFLDRAIGPEPSDSEPHSISQGMSAPRAGNEAVGEVDSPTAIAESRSDEEIAASLPAPELAQEEPEGGQICRECYVYADDKEACSDAMILDYTDTKNNVVRDCATDENLVKMPLDGPERPQK